ncbi:ubiquitin carboxyl-terminal hydrolase 5 [Lactifluus volemus]|nr:ubiquitin carboxyl-terminal hydrolase 5 [Lactifluus volemus]
MSDMETLDEKVNGAPPMMDVDEPVSVRDHDAFAAKHMPDLGHDVNEFKVFTWKLTGWKKLEKKITGPEFDCGGHPAKAHITLSFWQFKRPSQRHGLVYLDYADPKRAPEGWHACAQFALVISNPQDPTIYTVSHAHHRFIAEECDWGFTRFSELRKLFTIQEGHSRPTIEDECADVSVFVRVLEDPTGVLWHNFVNYDSKKETGYVGLKNQGATCYMNSLLQSLFCTRYFRKAVYEIPTEEERPTESVALALQRVFYHLQTSDQPVGEHTELTKSFGWTSLDSFLQHDVQEFNRGTRAEGAIAKLFVGKMKSYIKCVNVDFESSRIEEFNDLQLNVKGMKNLYESFRDYVAVETLDGENKYQAEGYGLQDAKKGIIFQSFPPVLHLQLKRFEYDVQRDAMVKINDRHEFPFEIDLSEFLDETADRSDPWIYKLHGVLVHSGDLHGGHYFACIKPDAASRWLKFDDDRVTPVTDREVLEENYGGEVLNGVPPTLQRNQVRSMKRFSNAYMLVYIREALLDEVLPPFKEEDTPAHLKRRLDEERLQVITDETFSNHEGFDLASFDEKNWPPSELPTFRVLKTETYNVFKARVAHHFNNPENQIRLWVLVNRQNKTVRPDTHIPENEPTLTVDIIRNNMAARQTDLRLYLDVIPDPSKPELPQGTIMVFLKHFDTSKQTLHGIGKCYAQRNAKISDLGPTINERMREIQDGDVICFQVDLSEKEIHDLEIQGLYSNPIQFYDFLQNRVMIIFRPKFDSDQEAPEFSLVLSKKQTYDTMALKVAEHLRYDHIKLRFTTTHASNASPKAVLKRSLNQSIAEIIAPAYTSPTTTVILYEKLDVSIVELETKRSLKVNWTGIHNREETTHTFLLPKTSMVHELADHLSKQVTMSANGQGSGKIRVFEVSKDGKTQKEFTGSEMIGNIPDPVELYAEEIPWEELEADDADKVISVFHFSKEVQRTHGVPFKFVVKPAERFADTKKRLQARIGASDKDFARFRFALIQAVTFKQPSYIEDEDNIYDHKFAPDDVLGLDHVDKSGKTRTGTGEKAIVIRG